MRAGSEVDSSAIDRLAAVAVDAGCVAWGVTTAEPWPEVAELLRTRAAAGLSDSMQFTYRNPDRSADATRLLRNAASIFVVAWPVHGHPDGPRSDGPGSGSAEPEQTGGGPTVAGRVAAYAAQDTYRLLRDVLARLRSVVHELGGRAVATADANGLVDREAAVRAGIGVYGRNCNVLVAGVGSWVVLGSIVTDLDLDMTVPSLEPYPGRLDATSAHPCGHCRQCIVACPTNAIIAPGVLDARRCLAWIVQAPGSIPHEWRRAVGNRVYGCDDCQTCCPVGPEPSVSVTLHRNRPADPASALGPVVDVMALWDMDDTELLATVDHWYVAERDPRHLRRTMLVVMGNTAPPDDRAVRAVLNRAAVGADPLLAEHAEWALAELDSRSTAAT